jgi:polyvinyl alcohol dehydrogenase (cytochrome)
MAAEGQTVYAAIADINKPDGTPGLYALRIDNGEKIWGTPAPQGAGNRAQSSAVSAMPGMRFSASFGGHLRAYSTKDGAIVWDFDAVQAFPNTVNGLPARAERLMAAAGHRERYGGRDIWLRIRRGRGRQRIAGVFGRR